MVTGDASSWLSMAFFGITGLGYQDPFQAAQIPAAPKQTQKIPLTTAQQYGWWLPQDPKEKPENVYPWIQSSRYPMINSPMTRFVDQMAITNKEFHLF
ncbi:hypothetical protein GDO78_000104 [Eleutherodactylus coqui]|uniref:Uncharacterized protein n=1 Tax=Eleutherodactylus coqui TaxID=57060 RepID=A0A8J6FQ38_ELECQ|nr:hypothetical protein GDO78_000104 [Eleutherodactylus coqui]